MLASLTVAFAEPTNGNKVTASMTLTYLGWTGLNNKCTAAQISNPYPTPTTPETFTVPGNPAISQIRENPGYYTITLTIDGETYTGIACFVYNGMRNQIPYLTIHHFQGTFYIGALGDMNSGFVGNLQMKLYNHVGSPGTATIDYGTSHCTLQGFGDFAGETLTLSEEFTLFTQVFKGLNGYCNT